MKYLTLIAVLLIGMTATAKPKGDKMTVDEKLCKALMGLAKESSASSIRIATQSKYIEYTVTCRYSAAGKMPKEKAIKKLLDQAVKDGYEIKAFKYTSKGRLIDIRVVKGAK